MGHIDAKAVDAASEPEAHRIKHRLTDGGVAPVEVGLFFEERVEVVLPGRLVERPGRAAEDAQPVIRRAAVGAGIFPHVPVAPGILARRPRFDEPGVPVGRMIGHKVDDDFKPAPVGFGHEPVERL